VTTRLPLFPLGTVLFPGVPLPLHIFEERYRLLVRELMELPEGSLRRFGVVAIREGREVGADGVRALHNIGCTAELRRVESHGDGRFDIVTIGSARFIIREVDDSLPYLQGEVDLLREEPGEPGRLTEVVAAAYAAYLAKLGDARGDPIIAPEIPTNDPLLLSYLVAATVLMDLRDKQRLLEAPDAAARLRAELALLQREITLLGLLSAVPPPDTLRAGTSLN
jgi:uncharacterized protein